MYGVIILFLIPIYYIAKSKGYNALLLCVISGLIAFFTPFYLQFFKGWPQLPWADATVPMVLLGIIWLLPARKGAPGKAYLTINFICPECNVPVTFRRHEEGKAVLCPKCGEIITVPLDQYSDRPKTQRADRPSASEGRVCFNAYGNEMAAIEMKALLEGHGITAEVTDGTSGSALPQLGLMEGFKIYIDAKDWDKALEIENQNIGQQGVLRTAHKVRRPVKADVGRKQKI
ncbi:MAG: hypothetical protein WBI79_04230 [Kiritimatiellia bacterium]|jgi:hypothetical protein